MSDTVNWDFLVDDIWFNIFMYINDPQQICQLAKVSRRFNRLCLDKRLWQVVHLCNANTQYRGVTALWAFIRSPYAVHVIEMNIKGSVTDTAAPTASKPTVTKAFLKDLALKCPKLKRLSLKYSKLDTDQFSLQFLPIRLTHLSLEGSVVSFDFLAPLKSSTCLPRLTSLSLQSVHNFSSKSPHTNVLLSRGKLTELNVSQCTRLSVAFMNQIPASMKKLRRLTVARMDTFTDAFIVNLIQNCTRIKQLDISASKVTEDGLMLLLSSGLKLTHLNMSSIAVTDKTLKSVPNMPSLRHLTITVHNPAHKSVKDMIKALPLCSVLCV